MAPAREIDAIDLNTAAEQLASGAVSRRRGQREGDATYTRWFRTLAKHPRIAARAEQQLGLKAGKVANLAGQADGAGLRLGIDEVVGRARRHAAADLRPVATELDVACAILEAIIGAETQDESPRRAARGPAEREVSRPAGHLIPTPLSHDLTAHERRQVMEAFAKALVRAAHDLRHRPDLLWQQTYNQLQWAEAAENGGAINQVVEPELAVRTEPGAWAWVRSLTRLRESQALIRTLADHTGSVYTTDYSPDGTRILSASHDGTLKIWDAATGAEVATLGGHADWVDAAAWSPDGTRIVSVSSQALRIRDTATGAELSTLSSDSMWLAKAVAWSPDGTRIVAGSACQAVYGSVSDDLAPVTIWDAAGGAELLALRGHTSNVQAVAWSPDGTRIVSGDESGRLEDLGGRQRGGGHDSRRPYA